MSIYFVSKNHLSKKIPASNAEGKTADELCQELGIESGTLAVKTPLFLKVLEKKDKPLTLYPKLKCKEVYPEYSSPDTHLTVGMPDEVAFAIQLSDDNCPQLPSVFVSFDVDDKSRNVKWFINEIISAIDLKFTPISLSLKSKVFKENEKCTEIFTKAFKDQLVLKVKLNEESQKIFRMRNNFLNEIESTEKTYVGQLKTIVDYWHKAVIHAKILTNDEFDPCVRDIRAMINCHSTFLSEYVKSHQGFKSEIAEVFINFSGFFKLSAPYISQYPELVAKISNKIKDPKINATLNGLATKCNGLGFTSALITPVQRLPRYILLLRDVIKFTPQCHPDRYKLDIARQKIENVTNDIEKITSDAERLGSFYNLMMKIGGQHLIKAGRFLELELECRLKAKTVPPSRAVIAVLTDMIVISKYNSITMDFSIIFEGDIKTTKLVRQYTSENRAFFIDGNKIIKFVMTNESDGEKLSQTIQNLINLNNYDLNIQQAIFKAVPPAPKNIVATSIDDALISLLNNGKGVRFNFMSLTHATISLATPSNSISICGHKGQLYVLTGTMSLFKGSIGSGKFDLVVKGNGAGKGTLVSAGDLYVVTDTCNICRLNEFNKSFEKIETVNHPPHSQKFRTTAGNNKIFLVPDSDVVKELYVFDVKEKAWSISKVDIQGGAPFSIGGKLYVLSSSEVAKIDPDTFKTEKRSLGGVYPIMNGSVAIPLSDRVAVFGGYVKEKSLASIGIVSLPELKPMQAPMKVNKTDSAEGDYSSLGTESRNLKRDVKNVAFLAGAAACCILFLTLWINNSNFWSLPFIAALLAAAFFMITDLRKTTNDAKWVRRQFLKEKLPESVFIKKYAVPPYLWKLSLRIKD